jgi:hypothetical protein
MQIAIIITQFFGEVFPWVNSDARHGVFSGCLRRG